MLKIPSKDRLTIRRYFNLLQSFILLSNRHNFTKLVNDAATFWALHSGSTRFKSWSNYCLTCWGVSWFSLVQRNVGKYNMYHSKTCNFSSVIIIFPPHLTRLTSANVTLLIFLWFVISITKILNINIKIIIMSWEQPLQILIYNVLNPRPCRQLNFLNFGTVLVRSEITPIVKRRVIWWSMGNPINQTTEDSQLPKCDL